MYSNNLPTVRDAVRKRPALFRSLVIRVLFTIGILTAITTSFAQTINIVHFNNTPTYLQGGGISMHINPQGVFAVQNRFVLQLMSEDGTTVVNNNIGQVDEFFIPVLNGQLPAGLPAGNYRLRVQAQNGANVVATSANSAIFTVAANPTFNRPVIGNPTGPILQIQCFAESNYFGSVNNSILSTTPANLSFQVTDYSNAFTYSITFVDHVTGTTSPLTLNVFGGNATFNLPGGRPAGYYTFEITKTNASGSTTFSYIYLFSTGNTSLGNLSSENVCVGIDVLFSNDRQVIFRNYPGSFYTVNYGDGSPIDTITHARFIQDSIFSHAYSVATCQVAGSLNIGGKYRAEILLFNKGIRTGTNNRCDEFVRNGNGTSKLVNTSLAPVAGMQGPPGACISTAVSILNQTLVGAYGETTVCETNPLVTWSLKRPNSSEFFPVPTAWFDNPSAHLNIPEGILDQIGVWQVRLTAQNPQGCNTISEVIADLCIEPPIIPAFTMNQQDTVVVCESVETNVGINNTTDLQNVCATAVFRWRVYNDSGFLQVPGVDYKIMPHDSATNPDFTFTRPGRFRIELVVESYCISVPAIGIVTVQRTIRPGAVRLPANMGYCGTNRLIDFQTDAAHRVSYNSNDGNEEYLWTITGGGFSFENGTTNTSRFPQIRFTDIGTYNVAVNFKNACGEADTFQVITFSEPVQVNAGADRTVCFTQDTIQLAGTGAPFGTASWSSLGTGVFSPNTTLNTFYTLTNADKNNGSVRLRLTVAPPQGSFCPAVTDSLLVTILPDNRGENREAAFCSGVQLNYVPVSSITGSSFTWTSQVTSGTVDGASANGTGNITDVLTLTSLTTPAVVVYTITPVANNCVGIPFTYTVNVNPIPGFTANSALDSICSGTATDISLSSIFSGVSYTWTSTVINGTATGNTNATNQNGSIADVLINNGTTYSTVRYTISVVGPAPSSCPGSDTIIDVAIAPVASQANAGADQLVCNLDQVQLNAVVPTVGIGSWSQTGGPAATITNASLANTTVTGLQPEQVYTFRWTVVTTDNSTCPETTDDVLITVRPFTTPAFAGNDTAFCVTGNTTFALGANAPRSYELGNWSLVSSSFAPNPAITNPGNPATTITGLQQGTVVLRWQISNTPAGCQPTNDEITIVIGAPTAAANAGPDQLLCNQNSTTLAATAVVGRSSGAWSVLPNSTAIVANTTDAASTVNGLITGANNLVWTVTDELCPQINTDTMRITVRPPTTQAFAGNDTAICITGNPTFRLNGNERQPFEQGRWFIVSSSFTPAPTLTSATNRNATLNNLQPGTVVMRWRITSDAPDCPATNDTIVLTIGPATPVAEAGPNQLLCDVTSANLTADAVSGNATGTWSVIPPSTGVVVMPNNASTVVNNLLVGENRIEWAVSDAICPTINRDTVIITIRPPTTQAVVGNDTAFCTTGNPGLPLSGNAPQAFESVRWTVVSSSFSPAPSFTNALTPATTITGLRPGTVVLRYTITSEAQDCQPTFDEITLTIGAATSEANAGPDQLLCDVFSTNLAATPVAGNSVGTWSVLNPSTGQVAQVNNPASLVNTLSLGENKIVWTVADALCSAVNRDTVNVFVRPPTTQANAGNDTLLCITGNSNFRLGANTPLPNETGRWTIVNNTMSPAPSFSSVTDPAANLLGLHPGAITLRWTITSDAPNCTPTTNDITIQVSPPTAQANAGPGQLLCNVTSTTLNATAVGNFSVGRWTTIAPSPVTIADANNPATTINNLIIGTNRLVWTVTNQVCSGINTDTLVVTVRPATTISNAGPDTAFCTTGNPSYTLRANSVLPHEEGRWTIVSSTISPQPSLNGVTNPNAVLSGLRPGIITLRWTITSDATDCQPSVSTVTIRVGRATPDANAGPNQLLCDVNASTFNATPVTGTSIGTWSVVPPSGSVVAELNNPISAVSNLLVGDQQFVWTVTDELCPQINRDTVLITVRPPTTIAFAGNDTAFCATGNTAFTMNANVPRSFEQGRWTVVSSSFTPAPTIANTLSANTQISGLRAGTVVLRWTISSDANGCSPTSDEITLTIGPATSEAFAGLDQLLCNVISTTLNANPVTANSTGTWTVVAPSPATVVEPNNAASLVNSLLVGDNILAWTVTDALCPQINSDTMVVTVRPPTTIANAGRDTILCTTGNASYQLAANTVRSFEAGRWTVETGSTFTPTFSNVNFANTTISNLVPGTLNLRWTITSDAQDCAPTSDIVTIVIADVAEAARAGADQIVCNDFATTLAATPVTGFSIGSWSAVPPSGATITDSQNPTTNVGNLVLGNNYFVWTVSSSVCSNINRDTVNIIVRPPITQAVAAPDAVLCAIQNTSYILQGNTPAPFETGTWRIVNKTMGGTQVIVNPNAPRTSITGMQVGTINVVWEITNDGGCPPTRDTINITFAPASATANAGPDQAVCADSFTQLNATAVGGIDIGVWSVLSPSIATVADAANPASNVINLPLGITRLVWTVTNNVCPPNSDTVNIERFPAVINQITGATTICEGQSTTITNVSISGGNGTYQYQWQQSTDNITFTNIAGATANAITVSPLQTTWYRRVATSLPCVTPSDTVQVIVLESIKNNIISANQAICINTAPATIIGTTPTGGGENFVYTWQQSTNNGTTWTTIDGAVNKDYAPGVLSANISYRRLVNTALCDGLQRDTSNVVSIQINPDASAVMNPLITENCASWTITNAIVNPTLLPAQNSDYQWYVNNQLVGTGAVFPGTTIALPGDSALIKMVAISRFGCLNDSVSVWFYTTPDPVPGFTLSDTVTCGPIGILVTNTTTDLSRYNFFWDFGQGQTSTEVNPGTIIFPTNPTYMDTVYTVTLMATGGCDTITTSQQIRVKSTPRSVFTPSRTDGCSPLPVTFRNSSEGTNMQFEWIFGDGTPSLFSQDVTVSHIYTTNELDTFYAKLVARNECGSDTSEFAIVVQPNTIVLDFAISGTDRIGCAPHTVEFFNNSTGGTLFTWDFGDGTTTTTRLNRDTVRHTYFTAGDYTVTLAATNGCSDTSDIERVSVRATPAVSFTASLNPICIGDTVRFVNTSEPGTYRWNLGDGTTSTNTNVNRVYRATGTYRVWLTGVREYPEGLACADSVFRDVIIVDTLQTLMTVSDSVSNCVPFTVTFRNTVTDAVNVTWDFGDGTRATGDVVTHTYTRVGTYTAVMVATVGGGCNYKAIKTITANGPTGTLSYNPGFACFGQPVRFEIISGGAQQYIYYFGDGDSLVSSNAVVSHTYRTTGAFVPYVVLANGACRLISQPGDTIRIDQVRAGFRFDFAQVCGSTTVTYTDTSRATYGITSLRWDLGDGTIVNGNTASQVVTRTGNYRIVLRANGASGCIDSVVRNINIPVFEIPGINIKGNPILCEGGANQLEADIVSADSIVAVLWDFGNGQQAEGLRVTANYVQAGTYTIRLTVRTVFGCTNTITRQVTVNPTPVVGASNDLSLCRGQSTILFATGADRYIWSPTQGLSCFDCASPIATPLTTTNYAVVGFNQFGCSSSDTVTVSVTQPFQITATQSDSLCIGSSMQLLATGAASYQWSPSFGLSATNIANPVARPTVSTTYRVVGFDGVNCFTDTAFVRIGVGPIPTLQLGSSALLVAGSRVNFTPAITGGPIRDYIWSPPTGLSCTDCPNPTATVNNDITYSLTIRNFYGCTATDTVSYRVFCQQDQIFIPNAFSPDGDGINDVLFVMGKGVARVQHFRIFNRVGQVVFERSNFDANDPGAGWDGKINGVPASPDVYVYTAEVLCTAGAVYSYKGNVTLFR